MDIADILERAADLIEPAGAWCQGPVARREDGSTTYAADRRACCWWGMGAIMLLGKPHGYVAYRKALALADEAMDGNLPAFNDRPGRTQAEVVAKLREAAAKAREQVPA